MLPCHPADERELSFKFTVRSSIFGHRTVPYGTTVLSFLAVEHSTILQRGCIRLNDFPHQRAYGAAMGQRGCPALDGLPAHGFWQ